jgi:segregation and condensation protein A
MAYTVKLKTFEGPLDLLLYLIKKEEVDIYDIPIAQITSQYLEHVKIIEILDLGGIGEFLVMAATLLQIKAKMLLPQEAEISGEEEEDPRAELVRQLLEYKRYKEAARELGEREIEERNYYPRVIEEELEEREPFLEVNLFELLTAFAKVLEYAEGEELYKGITPYKITQESKMKEILNMFKSTKEISFNDIFLRDLTKIEAIVTFLALLELTKLKKIGVRQRKLFGEIVIYKRVSVRTNKGERATNARESVSGPVSGRLRRPSSTNAPAVRLRRIPRNGQEG